MTFYEFKKLQVKKILSDILSFTYYIFVLNHKPIKKNYIFVLKIPKLMKKFIFLFTTLFLALNLLGQDKKALKQNQKALENLEARIPFPIIDVKDNSGKVIFKNQSSVIEFKEISEMYSAQIEALEPYLVATLIPLLNVGQIKTEVGQSFVYFPNMLVNFDKSDGKPHAKQKFIIPTGAKLKTAYNFQTENGPAIIMEFYKASDYTYSFGFILENKLKNLLSRIEKKEIGIMTDSRDNRTYKWVKIGNQTWFGENLQFDTGEKKMTMEGKIIYSNYNGRYYNYSQAKSACPKGWHLPSDGEWKELETEIGIDPSEIDISGYISRSGLNVSPGQDLISSEKLLFFARTSGLLLKDKFGLFKLDQNRDKGYYWTSTKSDEVNAIFRIVGKQFDGIVRDNLGTQNYFSCRCVEDRDLATVIQSSPTLTEITAKISASPTAAGNYFDRSIEFFLNGESNLALDDINKAIELDGEDLDQKLFKAQIMFIESFDKDAEEIRQLVAEYTAVNKDNDFAYYFESRLALYDGVDGQLIASIDAKRREKALELVDKALALDAKNPYYNNYRAKLLVVMGRYKEAITALDKQLEVDSKNGETYYLLGLMKLRYHDQQNKKNNVKAFDWCTAIGGACFKVTSAQLKEVCGDFTKAINYGATINPDYMSLCGELKQAETLEKHKPIVYTGPRGGRYTMSSSGNKVYIPRR